MQQITMCAMELDRIEPEFGGSPCRLHESVTNGGEPVVIEGDRRILTFCEGDVWEDPTGLIFPETSPTA